MRFVNDCDETAYLGLEPTASATDGLTLDFERVYAIEVGKDISIDLSPESDGIRWAAWSENFERLGRSGGVLRRPSDRRYMPPITFKRATYEDFGDGATGDKVELLNCSRLLGSYAETLRKAELAEREKDLARVAPFPSPPSTSGVLFEPKELDIYVKKANFKAFIFHGKAIDYNSILHLEYHYQDNWVIVVLKNGDRLDLGVHIQWLIRPCWRLASGVTIAQTRNGKTISSRYFPMVKTGEEPMETMR